jgi:hypothetical protein
MTNQKLFRKSVRIPTRKEAKELPFHTKAVPKMRVEAIDRMAQALGVGHPLNAQWTKMRAYITEPEVYARLKLKKDEREAKISSEDVQKMLKNQQRDRRERRQR